MICKRAYWTPNEIIFIGNKELDFVLLPNDIRRPNGREFRKLMEVADDNKKSKRRF